MTFPDALVLEAETGEGGIAICRWQRVDCVLVEVSLPDMSGFQVLVNLVPRVRHPEIPVIFLTRVALSPMRKERRPRILGQAPNFRRCFEQGCVRRYREGAPSRMQLWGVSLISPLLRRFPSSLMGWQMSGF